MHYRAQGLTIRTENAAKGMRQASAALVNWISTNVSVGEALDYGCGHLRYADVLARGSEHLGLVDSPEQLNRQSHIAGRAVSVRDFAERRWPRCRIYTLADFWDGVPERYDFVLCANVLSAIPSHGLRSRSLSAIRKCLGQRGVVLVANQHTNSYFTTAKASPLARKHLDGWILRSSIGASYFGIMTRDKVIRVLRSHRFKVRDSWIEGQSNYVLAGR